MAEKSIASAYINIIPSMKGFNNTLSKELGGAASSAGDDGGKKLGSSLLGGLTPHIKSIGGLLVGAFAGVAAIGAVKSFVDSSVSSFETLAGSIRGLQRITGGSVQDVSAMAGAFKLVGLDVENTTTSFRIFSKHIADAKGDAKATAELTTKLGGSFLDASGNMKPMTALLAQVADKFSTMPDGVEKTALATELFGRSGTVLLPILNKGSAGIDELTQKAKDMGLVLDDQSMGTFVDAKKAAREWAGTIDGLKVTIGGAMLPVLEVLGRMIREVLIPIIQDATKYISDHRAEFEDFATKIKDLVKPILEDMGKVLRDTIIPALKDFITKFLEGKTPLNDFFNFLGDSIKFIAENWQWLSKLALGILAVATAVKIATGVIGLMNGIITIATAENWAWVASWLANPITWIVLGIIAVITLVVAAMMWLSSNWEQVTAFFVAAWNNVVSFFSTTFAAIGQWFSDMWNGMLTGFQLFANWIGGILSTIGGFFASVWDGMVNGFKRAVNWIIGLFEGMINFIIDGINNFLSLLNTGLGAIKSVTGIDLQIGNISKVNLPRLATGGIVMPTPGGTPLIAGEAGKAEAIIPLDKLSSMINTDNTKKQQTVVYNNYATPGLTSEQELLQAMKRGRIQGVV